MVVVEVNGYTIEPGAGLVGANLTRANLFGANLYRAELTGADLAMANLLGSDLRMANLLTADLSKATANEITDWPKGFNPVAAGLTFK